MAQRLASSCVSGYASSPLDAACAPLSQLITPACASRAADGNHEYWHRRTGVTFQTYCVIWNLRSLAWVIARTSTAADPPYRLGTQRPAAGPQSTPHGTGCCVSGDSMESLRWQLLRSQCAGRLHTEQAKHNRHAAQWS
jgi:hypothetical protein